MAGSGRRMRADRIYVAVPYVGADGRAEPNPFAGAAARDPLPPERHLGYAITWWGLAAALVGVYLAYHLRAGRLVVRRRCKASMRYISTRGEAPPVSFLDAVLAGLAPDGGLYVPETWPTRCSDVFRASAATGDAPMWRVNVAQISSPTMI